MKGEYHLRYETLKFPHTNTSIFLGYLKINQLEFEKGFPNDKPCDI